MVKQNSPPLSRIIDKRSQPGLLLFNLRGKMISLNPMARQIMSRLHDGRFLQKIRLVLKNLNRASPIQRSTGSKSPAASPAEPLIQTTISNGKGDYSLQAFYLDDQPGGRFPMAAVLVTPVTTSRLNLDKARRQWSLSFREVDVMNGLFSGLSDKEIAFSLGIATETVRGYLKNIRTKLGVSSRTAILGKLFLL